MDIFGFSLEKVVVIAAIASGVFYYYVETPRQQAMATRQVELDAIRARVANGQAMARRLPSTLVPIVMIRVTPAAAARASTASRSLAKSGKSRCACVSISMEESCSGGHCRHGRLTQDDIARDEEQLLVLRSCEEDWVERIVMQRRQIESASGRCRCHRQLACSPVNHARRPSQSPTEYDE